jgi:hypothetical protein
LSFLRQSRLIRRGEKAGIHIRVYWVPVYTGIATIILLKDQHNFTFCVLSFATGDIFLFPYTEIVEYSVQYIVCCDNSYYLPKPIQSVSKF